MGEPRAETDAYGARTLDLAHKAALVGRTLEPQARGEDQFPAAEETLRVFKLRDGHPADVLAPRSFRQPCFAEFQGGDSNE